MKLIEQRNYTFHLKIRVFYSTRCIVISILKEVRLKNFENSMSEQYRQQTLWTFALFSNLQYVNKSQELFGKITIDNITHCERYNLLGYGTLDPPKLLWIKEIQDIKANQSFATIIMRKWTPMQLFKIHFLNKGILPIDVDFKIINNSNKLSLTLQNPHIFVGNGKGKIDLKIEHKYSDDLQETWKEKTHFWLLTGDIKDWSLKYGLTIKIIIL